MKYQKSCIKQISKDNLKIRITRRKNPAALKAENTLSQTTILHFWPNVSRSSEMFRSPNE